MGEFRSSVQIGDYLENKNGRRGICKTCGKDVFWTLTNLASHKRGSCMITQEEQELWNDPYVLVEKKNIEDYLMNRNNQTKHGQCRVCCLDVSWSNLHLASHKRSKCTISEEERLEWISAGSQADKTTDTIKIGDYLENKNRETRRGHCKACGIEVFWTILHLANHKIKKCIASERENVIWLPLIKPKNSRTTISNNGKPESTKTLEVLQNKLPIVNGENENKDVCEKGLSAAEIISQYMTDKNRETRRGVCKLCSCEVFWTISTLIFHKLKKCPIPEEEKLYWIDLKERFEEVKTIKREIQGGEINIGEYLSEKNSLTRRGTCKVCHKRVFWAVLHLACHKKGKCPISKEEKAFWASLAKPNNFSVFPTTKYEALDDIGEHISANISNASLQSNIKPKLEFQCYYCLKTFKSNQLLRKHESTHTNPYICNYCQKQFGNKQNLKNHILSHLNENTKIYDSIRINLNEKQKFDVSERDEILEEFVDEENIKQNDFFNESENNCEMEYINDSIFQCCGEEFIDFIELSRHQSEFHSEIFQTMIMSLKSKIFEVLSSEDTLLYTAQEDETQENTEISMEDESYNSEVSDY